MTREGTVGPFLTLCLSREGIGESLVYCHANSLWLVMVS